MENINIDNQPKQEELISCVNINQINAQNLNMNINEISNQNINEIPKINNLNFSPNMNIEQQNYNNSNNLINNNDNKIINLTEEEKLKCKTPISNMNTEFRKSNLTEEEKLKCKENGLNAYYLQNNLIFCLLFCEIIVPLHRKLKIET